MQVTLSAGIPQLRTSRSSAGPPFDQALPHLENMHVPRVDHHAIDQVASCGRDIPVEGSARVYLRRRLARTVTDNQRDEMS
jgi:hypothetical protein